MKRPKTKRRQPLSVMAGCATFTEEWNHRVDAGFARKKLTIPKQRANQTTTTKRRCSTLKRIKLTAAEARKLHLKFRDEI